MGAKVGVIDRHPESTQNDVSNSKQTIIDNNNEASANLTNEMPRIPKAPPMQSTFDSINPPPKKGSVSGTPGLQRDEDTRVVHAHQNKFINIEAITPHIDLKGLTDIFNSYATRKTLATGFFNLALVATNFAQMKSLIAPTQGRTTTWTPLNIVLMTFIGLSLLLQFIVGILLVFLAKQGEFIDEEKRNRLIRKNNGATLLVVAISIINIFINVFISI